ncbi:LLM class flavin-dependent oxidoreductase [Plantactinospora endophytica]|uniref:Monooxygenase n=1 Tax=Plantactinospora endophytica TaxID=673535 RepID=A0ABQ4DZZ1_9ACTN|nr:LLM class flavin-dependent oxidoreductase [Plantactinospora endophytica]GIG88039.1 monooxygenase [Plantactinospora endophytica]
MPGFPHGRPLHFNLFNNGSGHHEASWRLPGSYPLANLDIEYHERLAQLAESVMFDSVFLADHVALEGAARRPAGRIDPLTVLTAVARATTRIGLIATASTSYNDPFNLARRFAALDLLSGGRAGWNIVTTPGDASARNFGLDSQASHFERYQRADEFVSVAEKLWDSWEDDAIVADREAGVWADESKIHTIDHRGRFFSVRGPLNTPRSPQGHPVLVQAGSSEDGRDFAARHAEAVFTAQHTLADGQAFYADLKRRVKLAGRDPDGVKILPGIVPVIGSTEAEALELNAELDRLVLAESGRDRLARQLGLTPAQLPLDKPLPDDLPSEEEIEGDKSRFTLIVELARREKLTVRELVGRLGSGRGHRTFAGTPEQVVEVIEQWAREGAADGFNIMPATLPSGFELFVEHVVPILRTRGLIRSEYQGTTLREHYGLPRPPSRYAPRAASADAAPAGVAARGSE